MFKASDFNKLFNLVNVFFFFFLFQVNEECKNLRQSLAQQEKECLLAKEQVTALEAKITSLEQIIKVRLCFICFSFSFFSTSAKISFACVPSFQLLPL